MSYLDLLPNPFLPPLAGNAAPAEILAPNPAAGAAAYTAPRYSEETAGYPCCYNCGHREPCDEHCPRSTSTSLQIDEAAFMSDIEPVPTFLTRPIVDEIEELLEIARSEDASASPQRRTA